MNEGLTLLIAISKIDNSTKTHHTRILTFVEVNIIHLSTGYEGNGTFIVPKVPTILRGNGEENSWYRGDN
jgi:hypothetical protein